MYLTETIDPLALVSEMLCREEVSEDETGRFAGYRHNKDLCPGFRKRILRILGTYEKHRIDVHDVQGFQDEGVDVAIRFDADEGTTKLGLQIKSFDEIKKWKDKKDPAFLSRLRNQYTQALHDAKVSFIYIVLCTDAIVHREQVRIVANAFQDYPQVKVIVPEAALAFFRMDDLEIDVEVTRILCARDFVLREARRAVSGFPPGGASLAINLIYRALAGETRMTHDEYSEILIDAAAEEDDADPQDLIEAMNRSLVEDVGIHEDYRIVPDAFPAVCALYYDQVARFSSRSDAQARTWALLQEEKPGRRRRR